MPRVSLLNVSFVIRSARNQKNKENDQKPPSTSSDGNSAENSAIWRDRKTQNSKENSKNGSKNFGMLFSESKRYKKY